MGLLRQGEVLRHVIECQWHHVARSAWQAPAIAGLHGLSSLDAAVSPKFRTSTYECIPLYH